MQFYETNQEICNPTLGWPNVPKVSLGFFSPLQMKVWYEISTLFKFQVSRIIFRGRPNGKCITKLFTELN